MHDNAISAAEIERIAFLLEFTYGSFKDRACEAGFFLNEPKEKLRWLCFGEAVSFNDYALHADKMDLSRLSGYYSSNTNTVAIVKPSMIPPLVKPVAALPDEAQGRIMAISSVRHPYTEAVKIVHEAAHQMAFNTGIQKRGIMYPLWVSEGIATVMEDCLTEFMPSGSYTALRRERLIEMHERGRIIPLERFVALTRVPANSSDIDVYAQAWGLFDFMSRFHSEDLNHYLADLYKLAPGARYPLAMRREFANAFESIENISHQWNRYLAGLDK
jgi:hypothetical protein